MKKNETNWENNYKLLYDYILEHKQLPDKKKENNRKLLNWWKYNKRLIKAGRLNSDRQQRLIALSEMREKREDNTCLLQMPTPDSFE